MPAIPSPKRNLTGRHVLILVLTFFGAVFAVNGVFLYQALSSYTGVVAQEPYRKGLKYNERIAAAERQESLGWSAGLELEQGGRLALALSGKDGKPVTGLRVTGVIGRASSSRHDAALAFTEEEAGVYVAAVGELAPGSWVASVEATASGTDRPADGDRKVLYRLKRRLWVK
jgi:nitrogen fixation protein FixH